MNLHHEVILTGKPCRNPAGIPLVTSSSLWPDRQSHAYEIARETIPLETRVWLVEQGRSPGILLE